MMKASLAHSNDYHKKIDARSETLTPEQAKEDAARGLMDVIVVSRPVIQRAKNGEEVCGYAVATFCHQLSENECILDPGGKMQSDKLIISMPTHIALTKIGKGKSQTIVRELTAKSCATIFPNCPETLDLSEHIHRTNDTTYLETSGEVDKQLDTIFTDIIMQILKGDIDKARERYLTYLQKLWEQTPDELMMYYISLDRFIEKEERDNFKAMLLEQMEKKKKKAAEEAEKDKQTKPPEKENPKRDVPQKQETKSEANQEVHRPVSSLAQNKVQASSARKPDTKEDVQTKDKAGTESPPQGNDQSENANQKPQQQSKPTSNASTMDQETREKLKDIQRQRARERREGIRREQRKEAEEHKRSLADNRQSPQDRGQSGGTPRQGSSDDDERETIEFRESPKAKANKTIAQMNLKALASERAAREKSAKEAKKEAAEKQKEMLAAREKKMAKQQQEKSGKKEADNKKAKSDTHNPAKQAEQKKPVKPEKENAAKKDKVNDHQKVEQQKAMPQQGDRDADIGDTLVMEDSQKKEMVKRGQQYRTMVEEEKNKAFYYTDIMWKPYGDFSVVPDRIFNIVRRISERISFMPSKQNKIYFEYPLCCKEKDVIDVGDPWLVMQMAVLNSNVQKGHYRVKPDGVLFKHCTASTGCAFAICPYILAAYYKYLSDRFPEELERQRQEYKKNKSSIDRDDAISYKIDVVPGLATAAELLQYKQYIDAGLLGIIKVPGDGDEYGVTVINRPNGSLVQVSRDREPEIQNLVTYLVHEKNLKVGLAKHGEIKDIHGKILPEEVAKLILTDYLIKTGKINEYIVETADNESGNMSRGSVTVSASTGNKMLQIFKK